MCAMPQLPLPLFTVLLFIQHLQPSTRQRCPQQRLTQGWLLTQSLLHTRPLL